MFKKINVKLVMSLFAFVAIVLGVFVYNSFSQFGSHAENSVTETTVDTEVSTSPAVSEEDTIVKEETSDVVKSEVTEEKADSSAIVVDEEIGTSTTTKQETVSTIASETPYQVTNKNTTGNQTALNVKVATNTSNQDLIDVAKQVNDTSKNKTTIVYSVDATAILNNDTKTGELNRNYTYSDSQIDYGKVDYNVVGASVVSNKAKIDVISPNANSDDMFDISKELSFLIKEANDGITQIDVYFYNTQQDMSSGNYKWSYSDSTPNKVTKRETFKF